MKYKTSASYMKPRLLTELTAKIKDFNPNKQERQKPNQLLDCPFCGRKAETWYEFDIPRARCSGKECPASFGDDGVDLGWWQSRAI